MTIYFISDLHLHASRPAVTDLFFRFLKETAKEASALYILGDFFEVWVGDDQNSEDDFASHDARVIKLLAEYTAQGTPVYFMHGNRDFLIARKFAERTGCTLIPDPFIVKLYNESFVLTHGDLLCSKDIAYQRFRLLVRNPLFKKIFLSLPLSWRMKIAGNIRAKSRDSLQMKQVKETNQEINLDKYDVTQTAVITMLRKHEVYKMIHGHTHKPNIHEFYLDNKPAKRVVLGDWGTASSIILKINVHGLELFNLNRSLTP
jgi:UDP-2,3-diacylglucosamine hydrolase